MSINKIIYERTDTQANVISNMPAYYTALLSDQTYELAWKSGAHSGTDMYVAAPQKFWDGSAWNHSIVSFGKVNFKTTGEGDVLSFGSIYSVGSVGLRIDGSGYISMATGATPTQKIRLGYNANIVEFGTSTTEDDAAKWGAYDAVVKVGDRFAMTHSSIGEIVWNGYAPVVGSFYRREAGSALRISSEGTCSIMVVSWGNSGVKDAAITWEKLFYYQIHGYLYLNGTSTVCSDNNFKLVVNGGVWIGDYTTVSNRSSIKNIGSTGLRIDPYHSTMGINSDPDACFCVKITGTLSLTTTGDINADGLVQCNTFRIDQTPSSGTITPDKYITINCDGTSYKVPVVAA